MSAETPIGTKKVGVTPNPSEGILLVLSPCIPDLMKVVERCTQEENIYHEVAANHDDVLRLAKQHSPCVLLCSVKSKDDIMKIMNILKPLRALIYSKKVFPIAVSTIKNPKLQDALMKSGVRDYLNFPVSLQTLYFKLRVQFRAHKKAKQSEELTLKRKTIKQKEDGSSRTESESKDSYGSSLPGSKQVPIAEKDFKVKHLKSSNGEDDDQNQWVVHKSKRKESAESTPGADGSDRDDENEIERDHLEENKSVSNTNLKTGEQSEDQTSKGEVVRFKKEKDQPAKEWGDHRQPDEAKIIEINDKRGKSESPKEIQDKRGKSEGPRSVQDRRSRAPADPIDISRAVSSIGFVLKLSDRMISNVDTGKIFDEVFKDAQKKLDSVEFSVIYTPGYQQDSLVYLVYSNETSSNHTQSSFNFGSVTDLYSAFQKQKMKVCKDWAKDKETVLMPLKHETGVVGFLVTSSLPGSFDKIKLKTLFQLSRSITDIVYYEGKKLIRKAAA